MPAKSPMRRISTSMDYGRRKSTTTSSRSPRSSSEGCLRVAIEASPAHHCARRALTLVNSAPLTVARNQPGHAPLDRKFAMTLAYPCLHIVCDSTAEPGLPMSIVADSGHDVYGTAATSAVAAPLSPASRAFAGASPSVGRSIQIVVCIPCFRRPRHLRLTLESLAGQRTNRDFAVVMVENDAAAWGGGTGAPGVLAGGKLDRQSP